MIILERGTLKRKDTLLPESLQVDIEERGGRAVAQVGPEAPQLMIGDWLLDDTEPGKGIVWRVSSLEPEYDSGTTRITMEHIIEELRDQIIFGELELHGTAKNALTKILARSKYWRLGTCEFSENLPYEFDGDTLYEAVEGVCETLEDCEWDFDLSAVPFKLSVRKISGEIGSEMRAGRNIRTIRKTIDKSGMYTRFYPVGKEELKLGGNGYVSKNEDVYGIISRSETNQAIDSADMLRAWANGRLRRHCVPTVEISVEGIELADATGESLDRFTVGKKCRIPMPEIGETILERITKVSYRDKIGQPETVTVTMSNKREDARSLVTQVRQEAQKVRGGGRAGSKKAAEDHAWFTDTEDHVSMTAEAIVGKSADGKVDWSRVADITVSGSGIYSTVTRTEGDLVTAKSRIAQTENMIGQFVSAVGKDGKITAASIVAAVNSAGSSVVISADHITLAGSVKLADAMTASSLGVTFKKSVNVSGSNGIAIGAGGYISLGAYSIRLDTLQGMIKTAKVDGNVLTLEPFYGTPINFSKATTLSGRWRSGKYTVTAKQNSENVAENVTQLKQLMADGSVSVIGHQVGKTVYVYATENGGNNAVSTGFSQQIWIDAEDVYQQGKTDGAGAYTLFGKFTRYGSVSVEGKTYMAYITDSTSEYIENVNLYRK